MPVVRLWQRCWSCTNITWRVYTAPFYYYLRIQVQGDQTLKPNNTKHTRLTAKRLYKLFSQAFQTPLFSHRPLETGIPEYSLSFQPCLVQVKWLLFHLVIGTQSRAESTYESSKRSKLGHTVVIHYSCREKFRNWGCLLVESTFFIYQI